MDSLSFNFEMCLACLFFFLSDGIKLGVQYEWKKKVHKSFLKIMVSKKQ